MVEFDPTLYPSEEEAEAQYFARVQFRNDRYQQILMQQFQLAYIGYINWESTQQMAAFERQQVFEILQEQKDAEKKAQEDHLAALEAKRNNKK